MKTDRVRDFIKCPALTIEINIKKKVQKKKNSLLYRRV
jgi:Uma2 family endonuclease